METGESNVRWILSSINAIFCFPPADNPSSPWPFGTVTGPTYQTNEPSRAGLPGEAGRPRGWIGRGSSGEQSRQTGWCPGPLGISPHGREKGVLSLSETMRFPRCRGVAKCAVNRGIRPLVRQHAHPTSGTRRRKTRSVGRDGFTQPRSHHKSSRYFAGRGVVPADKRRQRNVIVRFPGKVIRVRLCGRARQVAAVTKSEQGFSYPEEQNGKGTRGPVRQTPVVETGDGVQRNERITEGRALYLT